MRKQTQLADLIAGSGLVNGLSRRAASQDGGAPQPVLYHFGTGPGGSSSTSKEQRHRPPLPTGNSSNTAGSSSTTSVPGLPPTKAGWSSPHASPAKSKSNPGTPGPPATGGTKQPQRSSSGLGLTDTAAPGVTATAGPLPLLELQRTAHSPEGHDAQGGASAYGAVGFLPAVAVAGLQLDAGQGHHHAAQGLHAQCSAGSVASLPPGGGPGPSGAGTSIFVVGGEEGSNWHEVGSPRHQRSQHAHHSPRSPSSGHGVGGGSADGAGTVGVTPAAAAAWQHQATYPYGIGGGASVDGGSGSAAGLRPPHGMGPGGRPRGGGGGGGPSPGGHGGGRGGGGAGKRGGRRAGAASPTPISSAPSPPATAALHRSSSDSAVRSSNSLSGMATAIANMALTGAYGGNNAAGSTPVDGPAASPWPSGPGGSGMGAGYGIGVGAGTALQLPAIGGPRGLGAEVLVIAVESSEPGLHADAAAGAAEADGWANYPHAMQPAGLRPQADLDSAAGAGPGPPPPYQLEPGAPGAAPQPGMWASPSALAAQRAPGMGGGGGAGQWPVGAVPAGLPPAGQGPGPAGPGGGAGDDVAALRRMVAELQAQVSRLTLQLRDSELAAAQLQSMAAAAAAAGREAAEAEAARKLMKALKSAEAARDKAELARHGAEKRARAAEEELGALRDKLEAKTKQASELEAAVASAQSSLEAQRRGHEEAVGELEAQHRAQCRKLAADAEADKKGAQDLVSKLQVDMALRNQTLLGLQADLDAAQLEAGRREAEMAGLREAVAKLEAELERERERATAEANLRMTANAQASARTPRPDPTDGGDPRASGTGGSAPSPSTSMRRGGAAAATSPTAASGAGGGGVSLDEHTRALRKLQTEVAAIREQYAQRVVGLEEVMGSCEAAVRDGLQGLDRLFGVLVSRTAGLLAGRLGAGGAGAKASTVASRAGAAGPGPAAANLLHQMNERLAAENASLLGELARWQSGRHAMLRKLGMTVIGVDPAAAAPPPPPLTHQQQIAQALAAVTGKDHAQHAAAAATPGGGQPHSSSAAATVAPSTPPPAASAANTPAREALAAAAREVLLAGRRELLPAVMTEEGWGDGAVAIGSGGADPAAAALHGGRAESLLSGAEAAVRLRAQVLALQAEVVRLRAAGGEATERGREREALQEAHEAALAELRRELGAAKQQASQLQRELERARAGIATDARPAGVDTLERDRLEGAAAAAREEATRHRAAAAAIKREAEARERQLEEGALRVERLEAQLRDARGEAERQAESVRRLRQLLGAARGLLREAGVAFMEEDPGGLDSAVSTGPGTPGGRGKGGGKGGLPPRPGTSDGDGPLFRALDAREREKELSRMAAELADAKAQLAACQRDLKRSRKQVAAQQEAAAAAEREQRAKLAETIEVLAKEGAAAKEANRALQKQLQDSQHEAGELRRQLAELGEKLARARLDGDYLRARAAAGKMKPRLSHARALSISISGGAASAPPEG